MNDSMPTSFILYFAIFAICIVAIVWMLCKAFKADKAIDELFSEMEKQPYPVELGQGHARREETAWRCAQAGCNEPKSVCAGACATGNKPDKNQQPRKTA